MLTQQLLDRVGVKRGVDHDAVTRPGQADKIRVFGKRLRNDATDEQFGGRQQLISLSVEMWDRMGKQNGPRRACRLGCSASYPTHVRVAPAF